MLLVNRLLGHTHPEYKQYAQNFTNEEKNVITILMLTLDAMVLKTITLRYKPVKLNDITSELADVLPTIKIEP